MINTIVDGLYPNLPFHIVSDFAHIGMFGAAAQWLLVRADAGIQSAEDLVKQAKKDPYKINYASSGAGSAGHLIMEMLQRQAGIDLTHVPYKGGAPALQDVLAGVVSVIVLTPNIATPHIKSGRLKLLAVSSDTRSADFKDAPTFKELGYPELGFSSWLGLSAPKGTPPEVVQRISQALSVALGNPRVRAKLELDGITPRPMPPAQYAELMRTDTAKWGQLTRSLKLKAE
jgi:tripartite-type tricarboxylate transporter receptor subunit TctC